VKRKEDRNCFTSFLVLQKIAFGFPASFLLNIKLKKLRVRLIQPTELASQQIQI
jgi:hypothetical protein